jgi:hypothetical protein
MNELTKEQLEHLAEIYGIQVKHFNEDEVIYISFEEFCKLFKYEGITSLKMDMGELI